MYQKIYHFPNGYGASVVCNHMSYGGNEGLFEVAVLHGNEICYSTSITDDVVGNLDHEGVLEILRKIKNLPESLKIDSLIAE